MPPTSRSSTLTATPASSIFQIDEHGLKWSRFFSHPSGEVILISSEDVHFRVDTYFFRQKSAFLDSMLSFPFPSSSIPIIPPLQTILPATVMEVYLNHVHTTTPPPLTGLSMDSLGLMWRFADQWEDHTMVDTILRELQRRIEDDAWEVLVLASAIDDVDLAVKAVRGLALAHNWDCPPNRRLEAIPDCSRKETLGPVSGAEPDIEENHLELSEEIDQWKRLPGDWREVLLGLSEEVCRFRGRVPNYTHFWEIYVDQFELSIKTLRARGQS